MDELRYRAQQPLGDTNMGGSFVSPPRNGSLLPQPTPVHDPRSVLPRRFTTESGRVPTLSNLPSSQRVPEQQDMATSAALHKVQLLEKKRMEYEKLREQKRRFEAEMQKLDQQQLRDEQELAAMQEDLGRIGAAMGHQSEPTTPPEYRETSSGFPTMLSRPNRYSTSSLTSPAGIFNRPGRSGSQIASPQAAIMQPTAPPNQRYSIGYEDARSVPLTRRNSDDDDDDDKEEAVRQDPTSHRSTNAMNRYSMPVTRSKTAFYDISSLDQTNTTRFLFGEEEDQSGNDQTLYQQAPGAAAGHDDGFPTLTRRDGQNHMMSSTPAHDLANGETAPASNGWGNARRHRAQPSTETNGMVPASVRRSIDFKYYGESTSDIASMMNSPTAQAMAPPPKLQSSYSANDVATMKSNPNAMMSPNNHAQQYLHNHNASLGRIPAGAMPGRHSRELSASEMNAAIASREFASIGSTLQTPNGVFGQSQMPVNGAHAQGPPLASSLAAAAAAASATNPASTMPPGPAGGQFLHNGMPSMPGVPGMPGMPGMPNGFYGGPNYSLSSAPPVSATPAGVYNPNMLAHSMQALALNGQNNMYPGQSYSNYGAMYSAPPSAASQAQLRDSQTRVMQNRRQIENDALNRLNNTPLETVGGTIYDLCKDQHGCRYLQKQLDNRLPEQVHMIWLETNQHVVELMTDPFGNYLCQKLLEFCNDEERTVLIKNAAQDMVRIALNQHGTRALQKMIEFVSTEQQVQIVIDALRYRVVELIQDINGNHVIQKCLNKLSPTDAQFIFDAVGSACVDVGTHRHGCCVLQRCIDHASGDQKSWLIARITDEAVTLIQDPFGNYVVQYIIDLNDPNYTEPMVAQLRGRICALSRHKFSSNVVEKCLRCSGEPSRDMIVEELLNVGEIDGLLRDSYANYVIQTALEFATPYMKIRLIDVIRPHLPHIRSTPYGRRIQAKIQAYESRSGQSSGQMTPADSAPGQIPLHNGQNGHNGHNGHNRSGSTSIMVPTSAFATGPNGLGRPGMPGQQAPTHGAPNSRPVGGIYAVAPPAFGRPGLGPNGMPSANGMSATNGMPMSMMPNNMPPNGRSSANGPGAAGSGMGAGNDNGETAWL